METRTLNRRLVLVALALVCAVAFVWATTALAGGSSAPSKSEPAGTKAPAASVQRQGGAQTGYDGRDCPDKGGGGDLQVAV